MATAMTSEVNDKELTRRLQAGYKLEDEIEMSTAYREVLVQTAQIAADLESMSLPAYYPAVVRGPDIETKLAVAGAIQDEMGHAQLMYRMLEDFGVDSYEMLFERSPEKFRTFSLLEYEMNDYLEFVCLQCIGDRAGRVTTVDLEENCSFAPYQRSLRKVNFEQKFHVLHGEREVTRFWHQSPETRERVQRAFDWAFWLGIEWFGADDSIKKRTGQITYRIRGSSNNQLRQKYLAEIVPFCEDLGIAIPAHYEREKGEYVLDWPFPILLDEETMTWRHERKVSWEEKFVQWKKGGPAKLPGLELLQGERWGNELWAA